MSPVHTILLLSCCASGKTYRPCASYENLCATESYRLCSPEGSELPNNSQARDHSCLWWLPSCHHSTWQNWACRKTLKRAGCWLQWPQLSTFPRWSGRSLLSCLSASTLLLLHVTFEERHRIPPPKTYRFYKRMCYSQNCPLPQSYQPNEDAKSFSKYSFTIGLQDR